MSDQKLLVPVILLLHITRAATVPTFAVNATESNLDTDLSTVQLGPTEDTSTMHLPIDEKAMEDDRREAQIWKLLKRSGRMDSEERLLGKSFFRGLVSKLEKQVGKLKLWMNCFQMSGLIKLRERLHKLKFWKSKRNRNNPLEVKPENVPSSIGSELSTALLEYMKLSGSWNSAYKQVLKHKKEVKKLLTTPLPWVLKRSKVTEKQREDLVSHGVEHLFSRSDSEPVLIQIAVGMIKSSDKLKAATATKIRDRLLDKWLADAVQASDVATRLKGGKQQLDIIHKDALNKYVMRFKERYNTVSPIKIQSPHTAGDGKVDQ